MESTLNRYGSLVGRLLLAFIFIFSGFGKLTGFEGTVGYIASKGLPLPQLAAFSAILVELGGGVMLAVGWNARLAAAGLMTFTALTAVIFHNFWAAAPDQVQNQMIHFMKNLSIMGGLLFVVVHGSGQISASNEAKMKYERTT